MFHQNTTILTMANISKTDLQTFLLIVEELKKVPIILEPYNNQEEIKSYQDLPLCVREYIDGKILSIKRLCMDIPKEFNFVVNEINAHISQVENLINKYKRRNLINKALQEKSQRTDLL